MKSHVKYRKRLICSQTIQRKITHHTVFEGHAETFRTVLRISYIQCMPLLLLCWMCVRHWIVSFVRGLRIGFHKHVAAVAIFVVVGGGTGAAAAAVVAVFIRRLLLLLLLLSDRVLPFNVAGALLQLKRRHRYG